MEAPDLAVGLPCDVAVLLRDSRQVHANMALGKPAKLAHRLHHGEGAAVSAVSPNRHDGCPLLHGAVAAEPRAFTPRQLSVSQAGRLVEDGITYAPGARRGVAQMLQISALPRR